MGLGNQGTSVSHRLCHVGWRYLVAPRGFHCSADGGPASKDQVRAEVEVEGRRWEQKNLSIQEPSQQSDLDSLLLALLTCMTSVF